MKKLILVFIFLFFPLNLYGEEIVVIVNENGPLTTISEADIREIYLGNMRFVGKETIAPVNYGEGPVKDAFLQSILRMTSKEYRLYWTKKVFQEGILSPPSQTNSPLIILFVRKDPVAIGYVPRADLGAGDIKGIKIIMTIKR